MLRASWCRLTKKEVLFIRWHSSRRKIKVNSKLMAVSVAGIPQPLIWLNAIWRVWVLFATGDVTFPFATTSILLFNTHHKMAGPWSWLLIYIYCRC